MSKNNKVVVKVSKKSKLGVNKKIKSGEKSISIKREWLEKVKQETFATRNNNSVLCFNFGPGQKNYYVIPEKLMKFLVEKLSEEED